MHTPDIDNRNESSAIRSLLVQIFTLDGLISIYTLVAILFPIVTLLLSYHFFYFDIYSHFQLQFAAIWLISAFVMLLLRYWRQSFTFLFFLATFSFPLIYPAHFTTSTPMEPEIYFMNTNAFRSESEYEAMSEYIDSYSPKKIALVEAHPNIVGKLTESGYKLRLEHSQNALSCAIFSEEEPLRTQVIELSEYPICYAQFADYHLLVVHPIPPLSPETFQKEKLYFEFVSDLIQELEDEGQKFILVGDFNSTSYSQLFSENFGEYFKTNFYSWNNPSLMTLPIDHALANFEVEVGLGDETASDHRGLFITSESLE